MRKYRFERDLKQVDLARLLNVDEMTIVNWELNRTKPRKILADRVNNRLGVEIFPMQASDLSERGIKK
jgi:DNA-binding XRE family transcriptional regulator